MAKIGKVVSNIIEVDIQCKVYIAPRLELDKM